MTARAEKFGQGTKKSTKQWFKIPEVVLRLLALIGGSPGALVGQILFRHKTKKYKFLLVFVMIVIIQVVVIFVWVGRNQ